MVDFSKYLKANQMATRGRKADRSDKLPLTQALQFIESSMSSGRSFNQEHCYIGEGVAIAYDGLISAGMPLQMDLTCCPHAGKLLLALGKSDSTVALTLLDAAKLSVKSGKFKATINCLQPGAFWSPMPDKQIVPLTEIIKEALKAVIGIVEDRADEVLKASIYFDSGSVFSTNRHMAFEYWHGLDLPTFVMPKATAKAILANPNKLTGFGCSETSVTFYFDNGCWIRSQTFEDKWPQVRPLLGDPGAAIPVYPGLFDAVRAVQDFAEGDTDPTIYFHAGSAASGPLPALGATFEVPGLPEGYRFDAEYLLAIEKATKTIILSDITKSGGKLYFFGERIRGAVMGMVWDRAKAPEPEKQKTGWQTIEEDDIPF